MYGYRWITAELQRRGWGCNHKRVLRLMRQDNLLCLRRKLFLRTTDSAHPFPVFAKLAATLKPTAINQLWVAPTLHSSAPRVRLFGGGAGCLLPASSGLRLWHAAWKGN